MVNAPDTQQTASTPDTLDLVLRKPVTFAKVEVAVLRLSEPSYAQLKAADAAGSAMAGAGLLISLNAGVHMGVVDGMCQRDFQDAMDFFNSFGKSA